MANNTSEPLSHLMMRYPSRTAILEEFSPVGPMAERIVPPFWYFIGFIGNPISATIWLGQRMRRNNSSAIYLGALSISDMLFLFLHLLHILHVAWGHDLYNAPTSCEIYHFLFYVPQYLSTFLVLGFTAERYVAVCHPFMKEKWCTVRRAIVIVFILIVFSMALASAQAYIWTYSEHEGTCNIRPEAAEGNAWSFWNIWSWATDVFAFGLVPLVVLVFNILVLREIFKISRNDLVKRQQSRSGNSTASTFTLLAVSFYLIVTQVSATLVGCLQQAFPNGNPLMTDEEIRNDSTWSNLFTYLEVRKVIEVICLSHYACYFFIYCLTGKHFRKEVMFLLTFHGRLPFLTALVSKRRGKERYSMVSTNGGLMSETYTTNASTAI
ncbi:C-C chemokine receptor type 5 [Aplysia californica]|uniref:C-C chemokine receptor type 5 n=1 Tax=Aplysia californica TaxID=6500 RepID=A0ABM1W5C7_APLCA|nr:C-C chemokine receptor type 5 [Aplysia californica]